MIRDLDWSDVIADAERGRDELADAQLPDGRDVATDRDEREPCERGTDGCCVRHDAGDDLGCETW